MQEAINFGRGAPDTNAFPTRLFRECADVVLQRDGATVLQYPPVLGFGPLREWLAGQYSAEASNVCVGNGSL